MQKWRFPLRNGGRASGLQNPGLATFKADPIKSLVREICQNSIDAGIGDKVTIEFSKLTIKTSDFPGIDDFSYAINSAYEYWKNHNSRNEISFLEKSKSIIGKEYMKVLRISDFNTSGLTGSQNGANTKWGRLFSSSGLSNNSDTAGGSYGIGKAASFVASKLLAVFYSSYDIEGISASGGVAELVTFNDINGKSTQGTWYYSKDDESNAIPKIISLDPTFDRTNEGPGTDIYIMAFEDEDWEEAAAAEVISNYYYAIDSGKLEIQLNGLVINKTTLGNIFESLKENKLENAYDSYKVLKSENTIWFSEDYQNKGEVKLGILLGDDMHKQVDIIRSTGMKIFDKTFPQYMPFAGILLIEGKDVNSFMRKLEDPTHTKLGTGFGANYNIGKAAASSFISGIPMFIKEKLDEIIKADEQEEYDSGMGEFLPDVEEENDKSSKDESSNDRIHDIHVIERKIKELAGDLNSDEESETEKEDGTWIDGDGSTESYPPPSQKPKKGAVPKPPQPSDYVNGGNDIIPKIQELRAERIVIIKGKGIGEYIIKFLPQSSGNTGYMEFFLAGETNNYEADLLSASINNQEQEVKNNKVMGLDFIKDRATIINVLLKDPEVYSMEVRVYAYKI